MGRKNEVSNDVSRGSGIAIDCAEGDARNTDESYDLSVSGAHNDSGIEGLDGVIDLGSDEETVVGTVSVGGVRDDETVNGEGGAGDRDLGDATTLGDGTLGDRALGDGDNVGVSTDGTESDGADGTDSSLELVSVTDVSVKLVKLDTVASVGRTIGGPGGDGAGTERDDGVETEGCAGVEGVRTRGPRRGTDGGDSGLDGVRLDTTDSGSGTNSA